MDLAVVGQLAKSELGVDVMEVQQDTKLSELGIASVDMVMFVYALEDKLGIELTEADLDGVDTAGELLRLISRKAGAAGAART